MFAPARKGRISCAVKTNAKNLRGPGERKASNFSLTCSIFATWYRLLNTDKLSICLHHRESLAIAGLAPHVSCFGPKVISKHRTKPNQRPKAERGMNKRMSQHIL